VLGLLNLAALVGILRVSREMRSGRYDEAELEEQLNKRGFFNRFLGGLTRSVRKAWHIYPIGVLFGLGFDTATEVALLVLAGSGAAAGLPWYAILTLPVLFAAGMSLFDTVDGSFMNFAYGWALANPVRKIYYNLTITGLSVAVAFLIGTVELLSVAASQLDWSGGVWGWLQGIDLNTLGFLIVGMFVVTWLVAVLVWRYGRIEEKWAADLRE
jgi:high-affinity nickel-transport protein